MTLGLYVFIGLISLSVCAVFYAKYDYAMHIKRLAAENSIEKINAIIHKDDILLTDGGKNVDLDAVLDHLELWENVKHYKLYNEL